MNTGILSIFTRSPLHVGAGASVGTVDQPVIRERATGYPVIPGSSLKGVLADLFMKEGEDVCKLDRKDREGKIIGHDYVRIKGGRAWRLFGDNSNKNGEAFAGALLVGEAKLLAFPVRSARGGFAWITSPFALRRFARDNNKWTFTVPDINQGHAVVSGQSEVIIGNHAVLEEFSLEVGKDSIPTDILRAVESLSDDITWKSVGRRLVILSEDEFSYFVRNNCEIAQHNRIDDGKGVVDDGALFNQENVPSETLFYAIINASDSRQTDRESTDAKPPVKPPLDVLADELSSQSVGNLLQIGADITTGLGWCSVNFSING